MKNSKMAALLAVLVLAVATVNAAEMAATPAATPVAAPAKAEVQKAGIGLSFGIVPYMGLRDSRIVGVGLTTDIVFCLDKNLDLKIFMEDINLDAEDDNNLQSDGDVSISGLGIGYTVWSSYGKVSVGIGMGRLDVNLPATGAGTDLAQTVPSVSIDLGVGNVWKGDKIDVEMGVELKIRWAELEDVDVFGTGDPSDFVTDFHQVPQVAVKLGILF
ncbi:MAG: hypothetical protein ABIH86_07075 [Planctomycetota bacterium]